MGTPVLLSLTAVQVQNIATVLNAQALPTDGPGLYGVNCASCHKPLATTAKAGASAAEVQAAINGNVGGMGGLNTLTAAQVQLIINALPLQQAATDGATLYGDNCASCHNPLATSAKAGASAVEVQAAINGNTGGMGRGTLSVLTAAQVQAIVAVLPATQAAADGATLYANNCASCHNPLATSTKAGATANEIQRAINGNDGGVMGRGTLSALTPAQVAAIAGVLPATQAETNGTILYAQQLSRPVTASCPIGILLVRVLLQVTYRTPSTTIPEAWEGGR